jgi:hypothetical protein
MIRTAKCSNELYVPLNAGNFSTSSEPISFSRRTLPYVVSCTDYPAFLGKDALMIRTKKDILPSLAIWYNPLQASYNSWFLVSPFFSFFDLRFWPVETYSYITLKLRV